MRRVVVSLAGAFALAVVAGGARADVQTNPALESDAGAVRTDLALQLVEASGGEKQADDQMALVFNLIAKNVDQAANGLDAQLSRAFLDGLKQETLKLTPQLLALTARLYAENCTEQELRDMLAFEKSETGQSMLRKTPMIQSQALVQTVPLVMDAMPQIVSKAVDDACGQTTCTPDDRRRLMGILSGPPLEDWPSDARPISPPSAPAPRPQTST